MSSLINSAIISIRVFWDSLVCCWVLTIGRLLPQIQVEPVDLTNKTAIVTGANSGIGFSLALSLAKQNATVYLACRNTSKGEQAASEILNACPNTNSKRVHVLELDTSSLASVRAFAAAWTSRDADQIDLLIHNAGMGSTPPDQRITSEGLGTIYATNFAGSFLLTSLLEPHLAPSARVILTSSTGQYAGDPQRIFTLPRLAVSNDTKAITDSAFYADTKFMQAAFASLLQTRFDESASASSQSRRTAHAFTPGYTSTPIFDKIASLPAFADPFYWLLKACTALCVPVEQGAATGLWLATTTESEVVGEGKGGKFWDRAVRRRTAVEALGAGVLERMWTLWEVDTGAKWA
ncbi:hypothetical protein Q7P37_003297 [Cladosporium fusiforme]